MPRDYPTFTIHNLRDNNTPETWELMRMVMQRLCANGACGNYRIEVCTPQYIDRLDSSDLQIYFEVRSDNPYDRWLYGWDGETAMTIENATYAEPIPL